MAAERFSSEQLRAALQYASEKQALYLQDKLNGLTAKNSAEKHGITERVVRKAIQAAVHKAIKYGAAPEHGFYHPLPEGIELERATQQWGYSEEGESKLERVWLKAKTQKEKQVDILMQRLEDGETGFKSFKPATAPKKTNEDLISLLTITDFHLGMYAWEAESGEDWDSDIARNVFVNSIHQLINAAPQSNKAILNQLGDFLHFDGLLAVTPTSGHVLDADTRYGKLVDLSIQVMVDAVRLMLKKFDEVHVIQAEGNHDMVGSIWMRKILKHMFEKEPRVVVDDSEFPFYAYLHGQTMLGFHHGHKVRLAQVHKLFASEPRFREMWGKAKQAYIHTGHYHHEKVIEDGGAIAEQHPTLAARDAYAARGGWQSMRGAKLITYHTEHGEIHRVTVRPDDGVYGTAV